MEKCDMNEENNSGIIEASSSNKIAKRIVDKKPVWGDSCTHCMACIANCPKKSIQYGEVTKNKEAYLFGKYESFVRELENQG